MKRFDQDGSSSESSGSDRAWSAGQRTGATPSRTTGQMRFIGHRVSPGTSADGSSSLTGSVPLFIQAFDGDAEVEEPVEHVSKKVSRRAEKKRRREASKLAKEAQRAEQKAARIAAAAEKAKSIKEAELKEETAKALLTLHRMRNALREQGLTSTQLETAITNGKADKITAEAESDGDKRQELLAELVAKLQEAIQEEEDARQTEQQDRDSVAAALKDLQTIKENLETADRFSQKVNDLLASGLLDQETPLKAQEVGDLRTRWSDLSKQLRSCIEEEQSGAVAEKDDTVAIETALAELVAIQTRLLKANLTSQVAVDAVRQSQPQFTKALQVKEVGQRRQLLSILASTLTTSLANAIQDEEDLVEKSRTFDERKIKAQSDFQLLDAKIAAVARDDLIEILKAQIPHDEYQELVYVDTSLDAANLTDRLKKLDAIQNAFRAFESKVMLAELLAADSAEVTRMLYAKRNQLIEVMYPEAQKIAAEELDKFAAIQDAANHEISYAQIGPRQTQMRQVARELADLQLELRPATSARLKKCEGLLIKLQEVAKGSTQDVTKAVDEIEKALVMASIGYSPTRKPMDVKVGKDKLPMGPTEMVRGIETGIRLLIASLEKSSEIERTVVETEGPEKLATAFVNMGIRITAFGGAPPGISPIEMFAIRVYTGMLYSEMNAGSRGEDKGPYIKLLNEIVAGALLKLPKYPDEAWPVFRAERAWNQEVVDVRYKTGSKFYCGQLWSTGARGGVDITGTHGPTFTHVIYGVTGRDIAILSANSGEGAEDDAGYKKERHVSCGKGEVLFASTCRFRVVSRKKPSKNPSDYAYVKSNYMGLPIRTKLQELVK